MIFDTFNIGFTGVASERPAAVMTSEVSEDVLYFGGQINFSVADVLVRITSVTPQYEWMANTTQNPTDTPVSAIFGIFSQVMPVLPWVMPFFLKQQARIRLQFTNSAGAPVTGGNVSLHGIRLTNPIVGDGWDYSIGFTA